MKKRSKESEDAERGTGARKGEQSWFSGALLCLWVLLIVAMLLVVLKVLIAHVVVLL